VGGQFGGSAVEIGTVGLSAELNSLVHTIGPGDGYFEEMDDAQWDAAFALGTMSGVRSIRAALPLLRAASWARIVTLSAHFDSTSESADRRLHRIEGRLEQRHQGSVEKPC
jgi:NAD(P)-dependent dehydrogenase (short-subunit alcohol dehydrogenase family)